MTPSHLFLPPNILLYRAVSKCAIIIQVFPGGTRIKDPPANAGDAKDMGSISELGRSLGEGSGNPLQSACLENSMDRGAWWITVHEVTKGWTWLSVHTSSFFRYGEANRSEDDCHWNDRLSQFSRGGDMSYHAGPHGEASGSVRRQRACGETMGKNLDCGF